MTINLHGKQQIIDLNLKIKCSLDKEMAFLVI